MKSHNSFTMKVNELSQSERVKPTPEIRSSVLALIVLFGVVFSTSSHAACTGANVCTDDLQSLLELEETIKETGKSTTSTSGVSISVDGKTIVGASKPEDRMRLTDRQLESLDIQIKFDGLDITRRLNVDAQGLRKAYQSKNTIKFLANWNYPDWINHAEIRVYRQVDKFTGNVEAVPLETIAIPVSGLNSAEVSWNGMARLINQEPEDQGLVYTLRVYDRFDRYDETAPVNLILPDTDDAGIDYTTTASITTERQDKTYESNIPLYGGAVTVYGHNISDGHKIKVLGNSLEIDENGSFVLNQILPPGDHVVDVSVAGSSKAETLEFERDIHIPDSEWFYIGLADLTVGRRFGANSEVLNQTKPGEYSPIYRRGRLAFYLKGKVKGETLITAALDTTEDDLDVLLSDLDEKDPRQLLRRLDPDDYYPVYGDDSTTVEDAPTAGRFYVRIERGKSHVLWGNFVTRIGGTELARFERGLYGAHAKLASDNVTRRGEPVAELEAFAAQPGTLPQRDEFRGTGGSAYFLRRQDINQGSEQITIEERDRITNQTITRILLRPEVDYQIDYVQGVLLLNRPLASYTGTTSAVREDVNGGNEQFLVAVYEYTPTLSDLDGVSTGGRGQVWLNDSLRVGVTGYSEDTGSANQTLYGSDILVKLSENSFFNFEWAQSSGDTFGIVESSDGGFIFNPISGANTTGQNSQAWRTQISLDLGELSEGRQQGKIGGYYEDREAGFNAPGRYTTVDERIWGAFADVEINDKTSLRAEYDEAVRGDGNNQREASAEILHRINDQWSVSAGIQHSNSETAIGSSTGVGSRTDLGARLTRKFSQGNSAWLFGQATVERSGTRERNDRIGVGGETDLTDEISVSGEVSYGTQGIGALAAVNYQPNATDKYYFGYRLEPDTAAANANGFDPFGRDYGSIIYGANRKINDRLAVYFEENYDFLGEQRSLTHTYGVTYTPDVKWTISGGFEAGEVFDSTNGDFERVAVSGSIAHKDEKQSASLRLEARFENGVTAAARDRTTYLISSDFGYLHDDDWRFIANIDALISESDQSAVLDGDYVEGSIGWAYRPVDNDRLNALFRYTYLYDLPGSQQVNSENQILGPKQRSHVLSGDFIYDLNKHLSVGAKYGYRFGEVSQDRANDNFVSSSAHLGILRADLHFVHDWDVLLEARALWLSELEQVNYGFLAGVYKHVGKNLKIGVGYNFAQFSDDLTDLTLDDEGVFLNVIGKF